MSVCANAERARCERADSIEGFLRMRGLTGRQVNQPKSIGSACRRRDRNTLYTEWRQGEYAR